MSYRVLIVDDDPVVSALITALAGRAGWKSAAVPDAHAALDHLAGEPCDLVISDVNMPGMSGLELRDQIRGNARLASIPIVLLTATLDVATADADGQRGDATLVLAKPVRPASFVTDVLHWMSQLSY